MAYRLFHKTKTTNLIFLLAFSNVRCVHGSFADWTPHARRCIQTIIDEGAGKGHLALFDFDNTILCRDIGDATLSVLVRDGLITPDSIRKLGFTDFLHDGQLVRPEDGVLSYSEHLLRATSGDGSSSSDVGYAWQIQLLSGLSVAEIVDATRIAYRDGIGARDVGSSSLSVTRIFEPDEVSCHSLTHRHPTTSATASAAPNGRALQCTATGSS